MPIEVSDTSAEIQDTISGTLDNISLEFYKLLMLPIQQWVIKEDKILKKLSPMQKNVLKLLLKCYTSKKIADEIHRSYRTIEDHILNIKTILNCDSKSEIIFKAIELHWISMNL